MAPAAVAKLIALQSAREGEIEALRRRLVNKPRETLTVRIVSSRIEALREIWAEVRQANSEIVVREGVNEDPYVVNDWFERVQGVYEDALDEFLNILTSVEKVEVEATEEVRHQVASGSGVAKLPQIPLPTFSGRYEDWASFCDLFTTLVHDVSSLTDTAKLQYLKLCLTGSAAALIQDVSTTSANYTSTWQALKARYHNPRLIINTHLGSLMEIPHLKRESASALRSFVDESQRIVRALENMGLPVGHWDVWLVFLLSERLDSESRRFWEAELSQVDFSEENDDQPLDSLPTFPAFIKFLERRTQALSMIGLERRGEKRSASKDIVEPPARKGFHDSAHRAAISSSSKCPLCGGTHTLAKCFKFQAKNSSERVARVKELQLCFNCLRDHRVNDCLANGRCAVCQKRHHTLLHHGTPEDSSGSGASGCIKEN